MGVDILSSWRSGILVQLVILITPLIGSYSRTPSSDSSYLGAEGAGHVFRERKKTSYEGVMETQF
jgi:hypothetical protein